MSRIQISQPLIVPTAKDAERTSTANTASTAAGSRTMEPCNGPVLRRRNAGRCTRGVQPRLRTIIAPLRPWLGAVLAAVLVWTPGYPATIQAGSAAHGGMTVTSSRDLPMHPDRHTAEDHPAAGALTSDDRIILDPSHDRVFMVSSRRAPGVHAKAARLIVDIAFSEQATPRGDADPTDPERNVSLSLSPMTALPRADGAPLRRSPSGYTSHK